MKSLILALSLSLGCLGLPALLHGAEDGAAAEHQYQKGERHEGGIGTYFMGREIAEVMGHQGADWLERSNREEEEKPSLLIEALHLKKTDVVADVGAGTGYYSFRIAPSVAKVLAVDIQQEMLDLLQAKAKKIGISNVESVLGTITDPKLPANGVDVVLLVDVYHEFDHPVEMMTAIHQALSPSGRLIQVEFRGEDPTVPIKTLHKMSQFQARKEMASFGFTWERTMETMPWQHVLIYTK